MSREHLARLHLEERNPFQGERTGGSRGSMPAFYGSRRARCCLVEREEARARERQGQRQTAISYQFVPRKADTRLRYFSSRTTDETLWRAKADPSSRDQYGNTTTGARPCIHLLLPDILQRRL